MAHIRQNIPGAPVPHGFPEQSHVWVEIKIELTRRGRTEIWYCRLDHQNISELLRACKNDADSLRITLIPQVSAGKISGTSMAEMVYENGQESWTAYPPIHDTGAEGFELFRRTLPEWDAAAQNRFLQNPFMQDFTQFEIIELSGNLFMCDELDPFARAVHACGSEEICITSKPEDTFDYVCRAAASADGLICNDFLKAEYADSIVGVVIAENLGAAIRLGGLYFLVGGTPEFMKHFRHQYNRFATPYLGMTSDFAAPGLRFNPAPMASFKRNVLSWITASEKYPGGLYEILHAHHFSRNNRQFIKDDTVCGCFHCLKTFTGPEITQWIDAGKTAMCPHCGIDSVLPDGCGHERTDQFLTEMKEYWFENT